MSLEKGDSIRLYGYDEGIPFFAWENVIVSDENISYAMVDSVYYLDGLKHIRTSAMFRNSFRDYPEYQNCPYGDYCRDTLKFIETIGPNISPMLDVPEFNLSYWRDIPILTCYETKDKLIHFTTPNHCYWSASDSKVLKTDPEIRKEIKDGVSYPTETWIAFNISGKHMEYQSRLLVHEFAHGLQEHKLSIYGKSNYIRTKFNAESTCA